MALMPFMLGPLTTTSFPFPDGLTLSRFSALMRRGTGWRKNRTVGRENALAVQRNYAYGRVCCSAWEEKRQKYQAVKSPPP